MTASKYIALDQLGATDDCGQFPGAFPRLGLLANRSTCQASLPSPSMRSRSMEVRTLLETLPFRKFQTESRACRWRVRS